MLFEHCDMPITAFNDHTCIFYFRFEVQNALISAQLETNMNYRLYETNTDLALLLSQYAKSIGEAPYK